MISSPDGFPEFVPEGCRECVTIKPLLEKWQHNHRAADDAIRQVAATDDELRMILGCSDPEVVRIFANLGAEEETEAPSLELAIKRMRIFESDAFTGAMASMDEARFDILAILEKCPGQKPRELTYIEDARSFIVKICGAIISDADPTPLETPVSWDLN